MKYLSIPIIALILFFGISSARELDEINKSIKEPKTSQVFDVVEDTAILIFPRNDQEEANIYHRSKAILQVIDLGTTKDYAYSLEKFDGYSQITQISLIQFPNWENADKEEGFNARGTDSWREIAIVYPHE